VVGSRTVASKKEKEKDEKKKTHQGLETHLQCVSILLTVLPILLILLVILVVVVVMFDATVGMDVVVVVSMIDDIMLLF
jgi:hypothetical protein